ncbi:peptide chain release factor N(5)-glutamine methyltransferase [Rufibacter roseus]|nr:peptide chain release factor N(5)-glutamine methyltransferase [Rufibacter roseus]
MKYTIGNLLESVSLRLEALYEQPEARTMAEWLLQHELGKGRMGLFEVRSNIASEGLVTKVDTFVERLLQHEPLQYVIGEASFYGRDFIVSPAVLIPRPETEELVQLIIKTYQSQPGVAILDIGTGSGCIPVTLAAELPLSTVIGLDVSADALTIARQNANKSGQKVEWLCQDILKEIPAVAPSSLDVIVSNPPYVLEQEKELMRQNVLNFEPHLALFVPDTDPLLFYRRIAEIAPQLLKNGGRLFFEINERYAASTADILLSRGFCQVEVIKDLYGKERILQAVWQ